MVGLVLDDSLQVHGQLAGVVALAIIPFGAVGIPWNGWTALAALAVVCVAVAGLQRALARYRDIEAEARGIGFVRANLEGANLAGAHMAQALLRQANLKDVDASGAGLTSHF